MKLSLLLLAAVLSTGAVTITLAAEAPAASTPPAYPLKVCVVSGESLGTMGKPFVHTYEGREVQFCCKSCLKDFNKDPQKFIKKIDAAAEKSKS